MYLQKIRWELEKELWMQLESWKEATSEQTLDKDAELSSCCTEWKEFHHVNWTKLMQILKETGLDSHERRLISQPYVDQCAKVRVHQQDRTSVKTRSGVRQGCRHQFLFKLHYLTKKILKGFGDFRIGGQVIHTVKYADGLLLMAKKQMVLQGTMTD